jgi:hypothetical protein
MVNGKFPNQDLDKIVIQNAKIRQRYTKKTDLFIWIHELCRHILVLTRYFAETKFQLGGQIEV